MSWPGRPLPSTLCRNELATTLQITAMPRLPPSSCTVSLMAPPTPYREAGLDGWLPSTLPLPFEPSWLPPAPCDLTR